MQRLYSWFNSKNEQSHTEEKAAISLQRFIRGNHIREKFQISELKPEDQTEHTTLVIGNDPTIPSLKKHNQAKDKIALIGTSGMRNVLLACELGNVEHTPKIIIIDNSEVVCDFWQQMREFIKDDKRTSTRELFNHSIGDFLHQNKKLYQQIDEQFDRNIYMDQNIPNFFNELFNKYGYDYVRAVIGHATIIRQSWEDTQTFVKIKNILRHLNIEKIYMYPSNIVACNDDACEQILKNIDSLSPKLSIHTDFHYEYGPYGIPKKVYLMEKQDPTYVKNNIFQDKTNYEQADLLTLLTLLYGKGANILGNTQKTKNSTP